MIKKVDKQGRLVLPKEWRERVQTSSVILILRGDTIILKPYRPPDITKYFDRIEVKLEADLSEWKSVRRELVEASGR